MKPQSSRNGQIEIKKPTSNYKPCQACYACKTVLDHQSRGEGPLVPESDLERKRFLLRFLVLHFRPATVPQKTLRFTLTWGLGGMAALLVVMQFAPTT